MSEIEIASNLLGPILQKLGRSGSMESVAESPQTEIEEGKLISLDISDLELDQLPADLFEGYETLEKIHASFNKIQTLDSKLFSDLENLKFLNLYGNKINKLPDDIFEGLANLEWLDLRSNGLEKIPESVGKLDNIQYLFLQNNPLSEHPEHSLDWAADFHSRREIKKFMPVFQKEMGLEVTMEKPLTREERARRAQKRREEREKKKAQEETDGENGDENEDEEEEEE